MAGFEQPGLPTGAVPLTGNEAFGADTNLPNGISPQTASYSFSALATYLSRTAAWVTGRFYNGIAGLTTTTFLTVTGTLYAYPVYVPNTITVKTLNLSVTTGQTGGVGHIGIYKDNGAGYPGALIYDSGSNVGPTTTAMTVITPTAGSVVLNPGIYWIATTFNATSTFPTVEGASALYTNELSAALGYDTAAHALAASGQAPTGISVAFTYGALPATFTSGAALVLNAGVPIVAIGV